MWTCINPEKKLLSQSEKHKNRNYYQWSDWEWNRLHNHFKSQIRDISQIGAKGPLPSKVAITAFLKENSILESLSEAEKIRIIKTKIFNERTKYRKEFQSDII